ncbi:hypothetical protein CEXT_156761 [Caerostris extrusa]|uniref:Uncharacterized protein n=1 Tax=Caerostris extrusa TaxID=172846 RepID=A0AAV4N8F9_CAEEX|nr:hypothetical protein CEXT_156761 [Caerostris extrusa]
MLIELFALVLWTSRERRIKSGDFLIVDMGLIRNQHQPFSFLSPERCEAPALESDIVRKKSCKEKNTGKRVVIRSSHNSWIRKAKFGIVIL